MEDVGVITENGLPAPADDDDVAPLREALNGGLEELEVFSMVQEVAFFAQRGVFRKQGCGYLVRELQPPEHCRGHRNGSGRGDEAAEEAFDRVFGLFVVFFHFGFRDVGLAGDFGDEVLVHQVVTQDVGREGGHQVSGAAKLPRYGHHGHRTHLLWP